MNQANLTPKMLDCIAHMKRHDDKLHRFPGGYWAAEGWYPYHGPYYGTPTVEALVSRRVATYTVWKTGRSGKFPIEVMLAAHKGETKVEQMTLEMEAK